MQNGNIATRSITFIGSLMNLTKMILKHFVKKTLNCSPSLVWADDESYGKLESEENHNEIVQKLDDENHPREFNLA